MEAPQLRQLGVGDIVDRVFALYRGTPLMFLALAAPAYLVLQVVFVVALGTRVDSFRELASNVTAGRELDPALVADVAATAMSLAVAGAVASVILLAIQSASLVDGMAARYLGHPATLTRSFVNGLRAAPRVIAASIAVFLLVCALWLLLVVAMVLTHHVLVVVAAVLVGMVGTVYVFASTLVMPVVATLEGAGPIAAIRRSWWLSRANRWRIIALELLLFVLNVVISSLLSTIVVGSFINDPAARNGIQVIVNAIATIAWAPVQWGTFTVLYYDLRVRHEAFDLQLAAEALPREP